MEGTKGHEDKNLIVLPLKNHRPRLLLSHRCGVIPARFRRESRACQCDLPMLNLDARQKHSGMTAER
jgi:hypothetical protein